MEDMLRVGVITSTHGLKGDVKVFPTTDDINRFSQLKRVFLMENPQNHIRKTSSEWIELEVERVKYFKQFAIVKFKGMDDINVIEKYKGADIFVTREDAVPLDEDEYFITDLIGLRVIDEENGQELGILEDVLQTGANDVYQVKTVEGLTERGSLLLPAIADCIKEVNLAEGKMIVHVMKGLLDL